MITIKTFSRIVVVLAACLIFAHATLGQPEIFTIDGPADASNWAVNDSTGQIFCSAGSTGEIIEYDLQGQETARLKIGTEPGELIVKTDKLVVACEKTNSLFVVDVKKMELLGEIDLANDIPNALFCSRIDNDFVYCACGNPGSRKGDYEIVQLNIDQLKIVNRLQIDPSTGWGRRHPGHIAMSANGNALVIDARGSARPSGAELIRVGESSFEFIPGKSHHESFGQIVAGPANRFWTLGNKLYDQDLKTLIRTFRGTTSSIHPEYDLVVSSDGYQLFLDRFSDAKALASIMLRQQTDDDRGRNGMSGAADICIQTVVGSSKVVVATETKGYVVDLQTCGLDLKPALTIVNPGEFRIRPDEKLEAPLYLTNSRLARNSAFQLISGPKGANVDGNRVRWSPGNDMVGRHELVVQAVSGQLRDEITIDLYVELPHIELNFDVVGIDVDPDGNNAAAWGAKVSDDPNQPDRRSRPQGPDEFAILDLDKHEVIVQKPLAKGVRFSVVDDKYAYFIPKIGSVLYRVDRHSLGNSKRYFVKGQVHDLMRYRRDSVAVVVDQSNQPSHHTNRVLLVLDRETMSPVVEHPLATGSGSHGLTQVNQVGPDLIALPGKIININTGELVVITERPSLPIQGATNSSSQMPGMATAKSTFGRWLNSNELSGALDPRIAILTGRTNVISPYDPLLFTLRLMDHRRAVSYMSPTFVDIRNLVDGELIDSKLIDTEHVIRRRSSLEHHLIVARKEKLVIAKDNRVLSFPILTKWLDDVSMPLHFPWKKHPVLKVNKPDRIDVSAKGGSGKLEYSMGSEAPWFEIDSDTGEIQVDTPELWKKHVLQFGQFKASQSPIQFQHQNLPYSVNTSESFEQLTGQKLPPDQEPFAIPIHVLVSDEQGQQDRIRFYVLASGPRSEVDSEVERLALIEQQQSEEQAKRQAEMLRQAELNQAEKQAKQAGDAERMEELGTRMRRIETILDSVIKKLDELEKAKRARNEDSDGL